MAELLWMSASQHPWDYFTYKMVAAPDGTYKVQVLKVGVSLQQAQQESRSTDSHGTFKELVFQHSQGMISAPHLTYSVLEKARGRLMEDAYRVWDEGLSLERALSTARKFELAVIDDLTVSRFKADGLIVK